MHDGVREGNLEDAPVPAWADRRALAGSTNHIYVRRPMISVRFYAFNTRTKPLDDRRVRQAIAHAIDREAIIETVYSGQYTLARGILPPERSDSIQLTGYPYDPQKARTLLAEAGYPGGQGLPPSPSGTGRSRPTSCASRI